MLTEAQMGLALRAVSEISEESLTVIALKLIDDIRAGKYDDGHRLTSRVSVSDIKQVDNWWTNPYYVALIVASASGNLIRLTCRSVGVNPCMGDWQQMLFITSTTEHIEVNVALTLIASAVEEANRMAYH
ncbi:hypothetical protein D3C73_829480 [compost metagenome]